MAGTTISAYCQLRLTIQLLVRLFEANFGQLLTR